MAWGCLSLNCVERIHVIEDTLTSPKYVRILSNHMLPSARELFDGEFIFQQDGDSKHTAKNTKAWLQGKISRC